MQTIDYNKLVQAIKPQAQISDDANKMANALIIELGIHAGQGLAVFVGMPAIPDNHKALRRWVEQHLSAETDYVFEELQCQLEKKLYDLLPKNLFILPIKEAIMLNVLFGLDFMMTLEQKQLSLDYWSVVDTKENYASHIQHLYKNYKVEVAETFETVKISYVCLDDVTCSRMWYALSYLSDCQCSYHAK